MRTIVIRSGWMALLVALAFAGSPARAGERTVVVMLFDGFAPAYIDDFETPNFDRLAEQGAWTRHMDPAFPTISLVNGVTISTGCWPEHHGIVTNKFIDPARGFYDHSSDADWLTGCEHMQQAAERQGVPTAAMGWVGNRSGTRGAQASYVPPTEIKYADYPEDSQRATQVIEQLMRPVGERPRLILAYFKGPDGVGHFKGMKAPETQAAVEAADEQVGRVLDAIDARTDAEDIQLIITTDHGMVPVTRIVNIVRILRRLDIPARAVSTGTTSFLYFDRESLADASDASLASAVDDAVAKLSRYSEFDVVRPASPPPGWHIGTGSRVGDLVVSAHPPFFIEDISSFPWFLRWLQYVGPDTLDSSASLKASHGYPTGTPGVEGILYARGNAFAKGREVEHVRAIDIHPTVMQLLGIEPGRPIDGVVAVDLLR